MARQPKLADAVLDLPVTYGNVSIGDKTARVGIVVDRSQISISQADKNLVGKRLVGTIMAAPPDEDPDQGHLEGFGDGKVELRGAFDVKQLGVTAKQISCGLTFALASVDVSVLAHFAKRIGRFVVQEISDIPEADSNGDGED